MVNCRSLPAERTVASRFSTEGKYSAREELSFCQNRHRHETAGALSAFESWSRKRQSASADRIKVCSTKKLTEEREIEMIESRIAIAKRMNVALHV